MGQDIDSGVSVVVNQLASNSEVAQALAKKLWRPGDETSFTMATKRDGCNVMTWEVDVVPVPTFEVRQA